MRSKLFAIGLGIFVFALIATLPATLLGSLLKDASDGRLRLVDARGTLWSGTGQVELRDIDDRASVAKKIAWRSQPWLLFLGRLDFDVAVDQSPNRFPVTVSFTQIKVSNADISLPATVLGLAVPKLAPLALGGEVSLHVADVSVKGNAMRGNATLQWRSASSALTSVSPLGDYELSLTGDGAMPHATLRTLQGPLVIEGKEFPSASGPPTFQVTLTVPASIRQQLTPLLRLIAVERSEGSFELQVK
jgi:general secretion pathway protein N